MSRTLVAEIASSADFRYNVRMTSLQLGYARVSTDPQSLDQQIDALVAAGVPPENIYSDKMSGTKADRPGLERVLEIARDGDTITVTALDRLGRSIVHAIQTIELLNQRGIVLKSLRENLDFSTPTGKLMATIFSALAEYELALIRERSAAARASAAARGKQTGRPRSLSVDQVRLAQRMHDTGESVSMISRTLGVSRATIYRAIERLAASAL
jgi:DNA invertase Pin-like site-specific DNA recombinase